MALKSKNLPEEFEVETVKEPEQISFDDLVFEAEFVDESELEDSYTEADEDLEDDSLFDSSLSDEADDLMIFDNDLATDNLMNDEDILDE